MVWKSDGRVKGKAVGVWSGGKKPLPESKGKPLECGLVEKSDGWVKGKAVECGLVGKSDGWGKGEAVGVWSSGKKRHLGQRGSRVSVVWWEKVMAGSKGKALECGLVGKSDGWVKGKAAGVWSGGEKRWLGQREKPCECGLVGKSAA